MPQMKPLLWLNHYFFVNSLVLTFLMNVYYKKSFKYQLTATENIIKINSWLW